MKKSMAKRKTAKDLVKESAQGRSATKWASSLSSEDQIYVCSVLAAMKRTPDAAPYVVARGLKKELRLEVSVGTIAKTLKEMLNA